MNIVQVDHIITFAQVNSIDEYVVEYRTRGFVVDEATYRYQPGLRNRFILLGCEYLELVWVEDEAAFSAGGTEQFARMFPNLPILRRSARPFTVPFKTDSIESLHETWAARGYHLPSTWSFAPPGMPPVLSFQEIPSDVLPGASPFALTYHSGPADNTRQVQVAPNTVYALEGITLVCATPEANAIRWRDLLAPRTAIEQHNDVYRFMIDAHWMQWTTPERYRSVYGLQWTKAAHKHGDIAALQLLADDLDTTEAMLGAGTKRQQETRTGERYLVTMPDARDGVTFIIREYPVETWRTERMAVTGESLTVQPN